MNFLAHLLLGPDEPQQALGGLLGDFVKGPLAAIQLPAPVRKGIWLHRKVDSFTDRHELVKRSKARVSPERRRYAGIMVDMFYDHLLARHWQRFSERSLEEFTARMYRAVTEQKDLLPDNARTILLRMVDEDWLCSYAQLDQLHLTLDNMARLRLRPGNTLSGSAFELERGYREFENDFLRFMPQAIDYAESCIRAARYRGIVPDVGMIP